MELLHGGNNFNIIVNNKKNNVFVLGLRWNNYYKDDFSLWIMNKYMEEFYQLNARVNLSKTEDQLIAHYIGGLKLVIQDRLAL